MNWRTPLALISVIAAVTLAGCSVKTVNTPPAPASPPTAQSEDADIQEALAKLSDADRAAAIKQEVCPVGGGKLGSMGVPPKVTVEGQEVFLCCSGCEEELRKEPATYLAKLKSK